MTLLPDTSRTRHILTNIPTPEWVILAARNPNGPGVILIASDQMTEAQLLALHADTIYPEQLSAAWIRYGVAGLGFRVEMTDFVIAYGRTYPDAIEALFRRWQPPPSPSPPDEPTEPVPPAITMQPHEKSPS